MRTTNEDAPKMNVFGNGVLNAVANPQR